MEVGQEDQCLGAYPGLGSFGSIDSNVAEKGKGALGRKPNLLDAYPLLQIEEDFRGAGGVGGYGAVPPCTGRF